MFALGAKIGRGIATTWLGAIREALTRLKEETSTVSRRMEIGPPVGDIES